MKRYIKWFLMTVGFLLVVLTIMYPLIMSLLLLFICHVLIYPFFPFYVAIIHADILYLSITIFILLILIGKQIIRKKFPYLTKYSLPLLFLGLLPIFGLMSYYEATAYIKNIAYTKYHTSPTWVSINLTKLVSFDFFSIHRPTYGSHHAEMKIDQYVYHWSFKKRDFTKDR